jgi:antitoxin VapB
MLHAKAKLFTHGGSQAVRLPKAFRFEGQDVLIRKEGNAVILKPKPKDFSALWKELDALRDPDDLFPYPPPQPLMGDPSNLDE